MALSATIFKATLKIADMDRGYYRDHALTLARHPSETDERLMMRLLAFALNADDALQFGRGLSAEDEPALWRKDDTGTVQAWIEVGMPDERALRKACHRAGQVLVYNYGGRVAAMWRQHNAAAFAALPNLAIYDIAAADSQALAGLAERQMRLHCTVQEGQVWLGDDTRTVALTPKPYRGAAD